MWKGQGLAKCVPTWFPVPLWFVLGVYISIWFSLSLPIPTHVALSYEQVPGGSSFPSYFGATRLRTRAVSIYVRHAAVHGSPEDSALLYHHQGILGPRTALNARFLNGWVLWGSAGAPSVGQPELLCLIRKRSAHVLYHAVLGLSSAVRCTRQRHRWYNPDGPNPGGIHHRLP